MLSAVWPRFNWSCSVDNPCVFAPPSQSIPPRSVGLCSSTLTEARWKIQGRSCWDLGSLPAVLQALSSLPIPCRSTFASTRGLLDTCEQVRCPVEWWFHQICCIQLCEIRSKWQATQVQSACLWTHPHRQTHFQTIQFLLAHCNCRVWLPCSIQQARFRFCRPTIGCWAVAVVLLEHTGTQLWQCGFCGWQSSLEGAHLPLECWSSWTIHKKENCSVGDTSHDNLDFICCCCSLMDGFCLMVSKQVSVLSTDHLFLLCSIKLTVFPWVHPMQLQQNATSLRAKTSHNPTFQPDAAACHCFVLQTHPPFTPFNACVPCPWLPQFQRS